MSLLSSRVGLGAAVPWDLGMGEAQCGACERRAITVMNCGGRKCLLSRRGRGVAGDLWWCKMFPTVLVFQKRVCLNRAPATSEDVSGLFCLVLFEVSSCSPLSGLCNSEYFLERPGVILNTLTGCWEGRGCWKRMERKHGVVLWALRNVMAVIPSNAGLSRLVPGIFIPRSYRML